MGWNGEKEMGMTLMYTYTWLAILTLPGIILGWGFCRIYDLIKNKSKKA